MNKRTSRQENIVDDYRKTETLIHLGDRKWAQRMESDFDYSVFSPLFADLFAV